MPSFDLNGKVALVTGGARGIGFGTCEALIARGARVVVVDLHQADCDAAASRLHPEHAIGIEADVTDKAAMQRAVARAIEHFGVLDVAVANAGVASKGATFRAMSGEAFDRVLDVDTLGVVRTVQAAIAPIVERRGHIVVVSSIYAFMNGVGVTPYAMSKAAVEQLGRALRVELAQHGASATTAYFGFIDTEMVHKGIDEDPVADKMFEALPKVLHKRLKPAQAGEGIVRAIEERRPRVILPRRWEVFSVLRGIINPLLDRHMERDARTQEVARVMDARADEEQPLTAT